jgi:hypothetical protein
MLEEGAEWWRASSAQGTRWDKPPAYVGWCHQWRPARRPERTVGAVPGGDRPFTRRDQDRGPVLLVEVFWAAVGGPAQ